MKEDVADTQAKATVPSSLPDAVQDVMKVKVISPPDR